MGFESAQLSVKPEDGRRDEGLSKKITGIIDEKPGGEIIAAIGNKIIS